VVDVTYADAQAYAHWLGRELPSEAQWEYAAKAGRSNEDSDRALRDAQGRPLANFWQGMFPLQDKAEDGFAGRAPVGCYPANPAGLHDMVGNVWEWTTDFYTDGGHAVNGGTVEEPLSAAPERGGVPRRVIKGGSYLCSADYCVRARASSRQPEEIDLPASHLGFRTIDKG
jgi:formylglycine-generating enzyme required for sulfatase activity